MVRVFAFIPRRQDLSPEEFHRHWAGPHAALAKRITTMRRYVQSHRSAEAPAGLGDAPYDGIAEVWFDDAATAAGMGEDPNYVEGAHADEPLFIDVARLGFLLATEDVLRAGPAVARDAGGVKGMLLVRRSAGCSPDDFATGLQAAGATLAGTVPGARRMTVSTALPDLYADGGEPLYDAVVELFLDDAGGPAAVQAGLAAVLRALPGVADPARSDGFVAEELRVIWPEAVPAPG